MRLLGINSNIRAYNFPALQGKNHVIAQKHDADTYFTSRHSFERSISFSTLDGKKYSAKLVESSKLNKKNNYYGSCAKTFTVKKGAKTLGKMILSNNANNDCVIIHEIFTCEHANRKYKGIGTELLKCAVRESMKRGFKGRTMLYAVHNPPPFLFYYKNNFRPYGFQQKYTKILDFLAKHPQLKTETLMPGVKSLFMRIDEEGARALLRGIQLYKNE